MLNRQYFVVVLSIFLLFGVGGCSKELSKEINRTIGLHFGGYTKSEPLKVYVSPFKPHDDWGESEIGKIAWQGAIDGTKDIEIFSNGKVVFVGPQTKGYYNVDEAVYYRALKKDNFWGVKEGGIKKRLNKLADKRAANSIIFGIYDGDDSGLKLTVYLYSKIDKIMLKERQEIKVQFMVVSRLITSMKKGRHLTKAEEELQKMIHEKVKVSTLRLLGKYLEGS